MDYKDLMVGDWVLHDGKPKKVECIWFDGCVSLKEYPPKTWSSVYADKYLADELEPIPLTEEILVKNGFDYAFYTVSETLDIRLMVAKINGDYIEIRLDKKTIGVWLDYDENGDGVYSDYLFPLPCYVHEFQHALHLCGIEKQIVVL